MTPTTKNPSPPAEYLQRILPGLPVQIRSIPGDRLQVSSRDSGKVLMVLPLEGGCGDPREEVFDGTLELFEGGRRLSREDVQTLASRAGAIRDLHGKRLVLNHTESGDPLLDPGWRSAEIDIAKRPTLARHRSERAWDLAQTLEGGEIRTFACDPEEGWRWVVAPTGEVEPPPTRTEREDRYRSLCRSIPTSRRSVGEFDRPGNGRDLERRLAEYSLGPRL